MAVSYATGKTCDVSTFDARYQAGDTFASWKDFCDCMFLEPSEITVFKCNGNPISFPPTMAGWGEIQRAKWAQDYCKQVGGRYSVSIVPSTKQTQNWFKCVSNFCAAPGGCTNDITGTPMPFNMSPFMATPPWTDTGAAARGIPKKDAGFMFTVTQAVSIDIDAYEPLRLWTTFWENPFLFGLLMAKITLIPVAGLVYQLGLTATGIPFALIPAASASAQRQGKDPSKAILDPIVKGSIKSAGLALKYLGKCGVGINIPCGAGLVIQKGAQDQIDTGEINKVGDPVTRGIIAFLAKSGDKLVDSIINSIGDVWGGGVFAVLEAGFRAAAQGLRDGGEITAAKILDLLAIVAGLGQVIASGVNDPDKDALDIADDVAEKVLGFRPSVYFDMLKGNATSAVDYAKASLQRKGATVETLIELVGKLGALFDELIKALNDISSKIGGGLDDLILTFREAKTSFTVAGAAVADVGVQVSDATKAAVSGQPIPALRVPSMPIPRRVREIAAMDVTLKQTSNTFTARFQPRLLPGMSPAGTTSAPPAAQPVPIPVVVKPPPVAVVPPSKPPPSPPSLSKQEPSPMTPFLLGAAGFFVAGPVGAAAGFALGAAGSKPQPKLAGYALRGFGAFGLDRPLTSPMTSGPTLNTSTSTDLRRVVLPTSKGPMLLNPNVQIGQPRPILLQSLAPAPGYAPPVAPTNSVPPTQVVRPGGLPGGGASLDQPGTVPVNTGGSGGGSSIPYADEVSPGTGGAPPGVPGPSITPGQVNTGLGVGALLFGVAAFVAYKKLW